MPLARLSILAATFLTVFSCSVEQDGVQPVQDKFAISQDKAIIAAENLDFGSSHSTQNHKTESNVNQKARPKKVKSLKVIKDRKNRDAYFVIKYEDSGFAIISADERVLPVLAYSETGSFPTDSIPAGLNEWLVSTVINIEGAREKITAPDPSVKNEWDRLISMSEPPIGSDPEPCRDVITQVGPLLQTSWGQGCGYNLLLHASGSGCSGQHCDRAFTGCVATAMAQVMKHHGYPRSYNWSIMPNISPNYLTDGSLEISRLMRDIGQEVDMEYRCNSSGTDTESKVAYAFLNSFGYSSARYVDYGGTSNYELVKTDISNNRPVIFKGGNQGNWFIFPIYEGGHAWVGDGFRSHYFCESGQISLLFYMNWGWDGHYNGWYALGNFNPGGYSFNYQTGVIVNIKP